MHKILLHRKILILFLVLSSILQIYCIYIIIKEPLQIGENSIFNQQLKHLYIPVIYANLVNFICIYLVVDFVKKRSNYYLILHLQYSALAYISAGAGGRGDLLGNIINSISILLSFVTAIYLCNYFLKVLSYKFIKCLSFFCYIICSVLIVLNIIRNTYKELLETQIYFELALYLSLSIFLLGMMIFSLKKYNSFYSKVVTLIFLLAIGPFILFYTIPTLLGVQPLLLAETAVIFLIIVPICLTILKLNENLVNFDFSLKQLLSYLKISTIFSGISSGILMIIEGSKNFTLYSINFICIFILILILLAFQEWKEVRDGQFLKKIGDYSFNDFYRFIRASKECSSYNNMLEYIKSELYLILKAKAIDIEEYTYDERLKYLDNDFIVIIPNLIYKRKEYYVFILYESIEFSLLAKVYLNIPNIGAKYIKTLEMFLYVVEHIIERAVKIDQLLEHLSSIDELVSSNWYRKLLIASGERERLRLSLEIHDTILQDLVRINRQLEEHSLNFKNNSLINVKENLLDVIEVTRDICEKLYPPFIKEVGLYQSLYNLFDKYKIRTNILLSTDIEDIEIFSLQQQTVIYRIFQELLSNAEKHSQARIVFLKLYLNSEDIVIYYEDDGIGINYLNNRFELKKLGLAGVTERVKYYKGNIKLIDRIPHGLIINISMKISKNLEDY